MSQFVFSNNVNTTLAAPVSTTTQTVIEISSTANLPSSIPAGYVWELTLCDAATQSIFEIVYVTGINGQNLTVLRGQENTTARTWNTNDLAYSCATAGVLASFLNASQSGNFVELSPPSQQIGSISVSGNITSGGSGIFSNLSCATILNVGVSATIGGALQSRIYTANAPYSNLSATQLAIQLNGATSTVGIGPSSGLSANGITASALAIITASTGKLVAIDQYGNLGATGNIAANSGYFALSCNALEVLQNTVQVVDTIASPLGTILISKTGGKVNLDIADTGTIPVGGFLNPVYGGTSIFLPNYGTWVVLAEWVITNGTGSAFEAQVSFTSGTMSILGEVTTGYDQNCTLFIAGEAAGNQTLHFAFSVLSGSFGGGSSCSRITAQRIA